MSETEPSCSFCHRPKSKVKKMICGEGGVAICNYCVVVCYGVLQKEGIEVTPGTTIEGGDIRKNRGL